MVRIVLVDRRSHEAGDLIDLALHEDPQNICLTPHSGDGPRLAQAAVALSKT